MKTLIIVDMQNDFVTGTLATDPTEEFVAHTAVWLRDNAPAYHQVVVTKDWHQSDQTEHIKQWGEHCMANTTGAALHPLIANALEGVKYGTFLKGKFSHGYSGFEGTHAKTDLSLLNELRKHDTTEVDIIGIATEHCVKATALDAVSYEIQPTVLRNFVNAVEATEGERLLNGGFQAEGVAVL